MGEETLEFALAFKAKHSLPTTHITSPSQTPSVRYQRIRAGINHTSNFCQVHGKRVLDLLSVGCCEFVLSRQTVMRPRCGAIVRAKLV
ncbi:MAG: hypothetical protein WA851_06470 [Xanthobacteraceae bacterium]